MYTNTVMLFIMKVARKSNKMLEPYARKLACTVLRREGGSNPSDLVDYKDLTENLHGDWINCGGGSGGRINPLQVRPAPRDDDDEHHKLYDDTAGMGDLALHMKNLEIFFSLYTPTLSDIQKALLKECLIELYSAFNIIWDTDTSKLKSDDFPIFSDLFNYIEGKSKGRKNKADYEVLSALFKDIASGSDSFLWNGITTIKTNSKLICLDTHDLQNTSDAIKRTQYFNILGWAWEQMSRDRNEKVLLIADEAYLMVDPNVPQSLVFLRNVAKRARKYEAGIVIISHSVVDFLDPSIRMYGQALLDIPAYKILMGCDGKNLGETTELYSLTDAEQELLYSKKRGHALLMIGSKRLHAKFVIPEYKMNLIGRGGGR